ncbi:hypothetical protein ACWKSP_22080 [Micromonosporaceae bacterium Da 78-11]
MTYPPRQALATHLLDQLDGAMAELGHHFATGERVHCPHCVQSAPAAAGGTPVRHQAGGQWCTVEAE